MNVQIEGMQSLEKVDLSALASVYQLVYSTPPWSEYKKCAVCSASWGNHQISELEAIDYHHCGLPVVDFWANDILMRHFADISLRPLFSASVAWDSNQNIIGFSWGYEVEITDLDNHLGLAGVTEALTSKYGEAHTVAYLADLAVIPEYRRAGLAKKIAKVRHDILSREGVSIVLARTKGGEPPSQTHLWYENIGFSVLVPYNDPPRMRVIRAIPMRDLAW